jgi:hypothetical protein
LIRFVLLILLATLLTTTALLLATLAALLVLLTLLVLVLITRHETLLGSAGTTTGLFANECRRKRLRRVAGAEHDWSLVIYPWRGVWKIQLRHSSLRSLPFFSADRTAKARLPKAPKSCCGPWQNPKSAAIHTII